MSIKKGILVLAFFVVLGTALTSNVHAQRAGRAPTPVLAQPTALQELINLLPPIRIAGRQLDFQFGGEFWIATLNGRNFIAGSITTEIIDEGIVFTLKQTHAWPPTDLPNARLMKWVRTPGPEIMLLYSEGPPRSLRRYSPDGEIPDDEE